MQLNSSFDNLILLFHFHNQFYYFIIFIIYKLIKYLIELLNIKYLKNT